MKNLCRILFVSLITLATAQADSDGHAHKQGKDATYKTLPLTSVFNSEGQRISLPQVTQNHASIIIAYRGSWCPYCMKHLKELQENIKAFENLGLKIIAISPDKPATAEAMKKKFGFTFEVLSDPEMKLGNTLGVGFTLDEKTKAMLKGYDIDVEAASGFNHYQLPHPSVFISDTQNRIVFQHSNPDYKNRMSTKDILKAAQKAL